MFATEETIFFHPGSEQRPDENAPGEFTGRFVAGHSFGSLLELAHVGPKEYTMIAKMMGS